MIRAPGCATGRGYGSARPARFRDARPRSPVAAPRGGTQCPAPPGRRSDCPGRASAAQRPDTIRSNVRSLRMIVKTVHTGDPDIKPTSILTANLIREFEKRQLERVEKRPAVVSRLSALQRVRTSTGSYVRHARAIVALRKMKFYDGLKLPDFMGFRGESVEPPKRSLPRPLDMNALLA